MITEFQKQAILNTIQPMMAATELALHELEQINEKDTEDYKNIQKCLELYHKIKDHLNTDDPNFKYINSLLGLINKRSQQMLLFNSKN